MVGEKLSKAGIPTTPYEARKFFLAAVIGDAVKIASGRRAEAEGERADCLEFLEGEKCRRWVDFLDVDPEIIGDFVRKLDI